MNSLFSMEDGMEGKRSFFTLRTSTLFQFLVSSMSSFSIYKCSVEEDLVTLWSPQPSSRRKALHIGPPTMAPGLQPFLTHRHPHSWVTSVPSSTSSSLPIQPSNSWTHLLYPGSPAGLPQGTGSPHSARWPGPDNALPLCLDSALLEENGLYSTCYLGGLFHGLSAC